MVEGLLKSSPVCMYQENVSSRPSTVKCVCVCVCVCYAVFVFLLLELGQLSGVAAILRFPLPQLDEDSEDSDTHD